MFKWSLWQQWREPILIVFACFVICPLSKYFFLLIFIQYFLYDSYFLCIQTLIIIFNQWYSNYAPLYISVSPKFQITKKDLFLEKVDIFVRLSHSGLITKNPRTCDLKNSTGSRYYIYYMLYFLQKCVTKPKTLYITVLNKPI